VAHLRLQQPHPRVQRLALELAPLQLERQRLVARKGIALSHQRRHRIQGANSTPAKSRCK
jgi:hypothetical protein